MLKEQIEERIKSKQTEVVNLEAAHQKFVETVNKQFATSRDQYNRLQGEITAFQSMLTQLDGENPA